MNRATKLILPVAALAIVWQSNSAAAAPVEPPLVHSPAEVPVDWTRLVDDTNVLQIAVPPPIWPAIDLAPVAQPGYGSHPSRLILGDVCLTRTATPICRHRLGSWSVAGSPSTRSGRLRDGHCEQC
jgi:hypothetical protein